jgi:glycosyltransferase involved in cell wall biosynthesis
VIIIKSPLISVMVAVFNGNKGQYNIRRAIESILNQTYKNLELVVVDGGSTDGTIDVVKSYSKKFKLPRRFVFVSEHDNGIYDAMNKGTKLAHGELVCFLNSDDYFYDNEVLSDVAKEYDDKFDFFYGAVSTNYNKSGVNVVRLRDASLENLKYGFMWPHQGMFVKRVLQTKLLFDTSLRLSGDFDFFCRLLLKGAKGQKINRVITVMQHGGASSNDKSYMETSFCVKKYFGSFAYYRLLVEHSVFKFGKKFVTFFGLEKVWHKLNSGLGI